MVMGDQVDLGSRVLKMVILEFLCVDLGSYIWHGPVEG